MLKITTKIIKKQPLFANSCLFHPTDAVEDPWGKRIIDKLAEDKAVKNIRIYNMLEDIVYRDESGKLCYDFRLNDLRLDYLVEKGFNLIIAYACIPPCLSEAFEGSNVSRNPTRYKGKLFNTALPKDYSEWEAVCFEYTKHIVERYGIEKTSNWYLHCFNEPDIPIFFMKNIPQTLEGTRLRAKEYCKLYKGFEQGVMKVSTKLRIGGPALAVSEEFLEIFLNFVKQNNLRLDYIALHNYSTSPKAINEGTVPIRVSNILKKCKNQRKLIEKCGFGETEIVYDEWGACTHGFHDIAQCAELIMRDTEKFSAFYVKMISDLIKADLNISIMAICLAGHHELTAEFSGFRNYFTKSFIKKPIYNAHILASKLGTNLLEYETDNPNISVIPTAYENGKLAILLAYADDYVSPDLSDTVETLSIDNIKGKTATIYRIDKATSNPYRLFETFESENISTEQMKLLLCEGELKPKTLVCDSNCIDISLSANAVILIEIV